MNKNKKSIKTVVLNGANGHLGIHILLKIIKEFNVIGICRNASRLINKIPSELRDKYYPLDIDYNNIEVKETCKKISFTLKENNLIIVGLVNNGFTGYPKGPNDISEVSVIAAAEGLFGYHVRLALSITNLIYQPASIINISSMYGKVAPNPKNYEKKNNINPLLYGSMKAALLQSTRYLSAQFAKDGIRFNSVSFGPFPSEDIVKNNPKFIESLGSNTHIGRIGKPYEATGIISFLLSDDSSFITGADIPVDGGWTAW